MKNPFTFSPEPFSIGPSIRTSHEPFLGDPIDESEILWDEELVGERGKRRGVGRSRATRPTKRLRRSTPRTTTPRRPRWPSNPKPRPPIIRRPPALRWPRPPRPLLPPIYPTYPWPPIVTQPESPAPTSATDSGSAQSDQPEPTTTNTCHHSLLLDGFPAGSSQLTPALQTTLRRWATGLKRIPNLTDYVVTVHGQTDRSPAENTRPILFLDRALGVIKYLGIHGVIQATKIQPRLKAHSGRSGRKVPRSQLILGLCTKEK